MTTSLATLLSAPFIEKRCQQIGSHFANAGYGAISGAGIGTRRLVVVWLGLEFVLAGQIKSMKIMALTVARATLEN